MEIYSNSENPGQIIEEKRPAKRYPVDLSFEFKRNYARQSSKAEVFNLSLSGALIKTDQELKPLEKINLYISLHGRTRKVPAKVIWAGVRGIGVQFQPTNNRDVQIVDDLIYYATEKGYSNKSLFDSIVSKVA